MDQAAGRVQTVESEISGIDLGDRRLEHRSIKFCRRIAAEPALGFPQAMVTPAELEGCYRLLGNDKVTPEAILAPHFRATVERASELGTVLAVYDSSEFRFNGEGRDGLGAVTKSGNAFWGHFCLAVSADGERDPLGVLGLKTWVRDGSPTPSSARKKGAKYSEVSELPSEQDRWFETAMEVEKLVGDSASVVHVMDSEADDFDLLLQLDNAQCRFIVRSGYDRALIDLVDGTQSGKKLRTFLGKAEVLTERAVKLARRVKPVGGSLDKRRQPRDTRTAALTFSARTAVIKRPSHAVEKSSAGLPINVVCVREKNPPTGVEPIDWFLLTTEPIDTDEQVLRIVDWYRARWLIEEYFRAIKSGCAFQKRQLETKKTILNALAFFVPVAWALLRMRTLSRSAKRHPIALVLSETQIKILRKETGLPLRLNSSLLEGCLAVARLGGHIKYNGAPGWEVLGRGYDRLLVLEGGYKIAESDRSDQW